MSFTLQWSPGNSTLKDIEREVIKQAMTLHKCHLKAMAYDLGISTTKVQKLINTYFLPSEVNAIRGTRMDRER